MRNFLIVTACLVLASALLSAAVGGEYDDEVASLTRSLQKARSDPGKAFSLEVHCIDENAIRAFKLFNGSIVIWQQERQVSLSLESRAELLDKLIDADFAGFEPSYGGRRQPKKEQAALRVSCRVHVSVDAQNKTSIQLFQGEQSRSLHALAVGLLDQMEGLSANGVAASSINDGLAKLADGTLAIETLELRLLRLPPKSADQAGMILRVLGGEISQQAYKPGKFAEPPHWERLKACQAASLVAALQEADIKDIPINLSGEGVAELEVAILGHRKTIIARQRIEVAEQQAKLRRRFSRLVDALAVAFASCA